MVDRGYRAFVDKAAKAVHYEGRERLRDRGLSEIVRELCEHAHIVRRDFETDADPRVLAAALAQRVYGFNLTVESPVLLNLAALAILMRPLVAHSLTQEVCELVDETDLHSLPDAPPRLFRGAWILEARKGTLFGDTLSLAGYSIGEPGTGWGRQTWLVGLRRNGAAMCVPWEPRWSGGDLAEGLPDASLASLAHAAVGQGEGATLTDRMAVVAAHLAGDKTPLLDEGSHASHADWASWGREAARFAVVFAILRDAEKAPIQVTDTSERPRQPSVSKKRKPLMAWVTRHVSLLYKREPVAPKGEEAHPSDLRLREQAALVRGHLKRQPHGPGGAERKWIYVESYEARRWISARPHRIVVTP